MNVKRLDYSKQDTCPICKKHFSSSGNLNKHIKNIHKEKHIVSKRLVCYPMEKYNHKCLEGCNTSFAHRMCLVDHLRLVHEMEMPEEKLKFSNLTEFETWLEDEQQETKAQFIRISGKKKKPNSTVFYLTCSRSGKFQPKEENRKRKIKLDGEGSCKSGTSCTSQLIVETFTKSSKLRVMYFKSHYGHVLDQKYLRIPKSTRQKIEEELLVGASFSRVLDSFDNPDIANKITRQYLYNIRKSMKVDALYGKKHEDDGLSVDMWVQECRCSNSNCILYYKKQGNVDIGEEFAYALREEDFCVIVMNSTQRRLLEHFGKNFVCIDIIHGGSGFMYELSVILVTDENNEVFPVSYMIANRNDVYIYKIFFENIKKEVGKISPEVLMTDIHDRSFDAWNEVMASVTKRLYSSWQVDYDWKSHLEKIWAKELNENRIKRCEVYERLKMLQETSEESEFNHRYSDFVSFAHKEMGLKRFYSYFTRFYSRRYNKIKLWGYCYRSDLVKKIDDSLKSMNKLLECEFREGRNIKRVDKAIHCLLNFSDNILTGVRISPSEKMNAFDECRS